jgi:hypothetical protein
MRAGLAVLLLVTAGCAFTTPAPPPRPTLPEVTYVAPCDAQAVVGLTQEAVDALRRRDQLLRYHIELLEQQAQGIRLVPSLRGSW